MNKSDLLIHCAECAGAICLAGDGLECQQLVGNKDKTVPACSIPQLYNQTTGDTVDYTDEQIDQLRPHYQNGAWVAARGILPKPPVAPVIAASPYPIVEEPNVSTIADAAPVTT